MSKKRRFEEIEVWQKTRLGEIIDNGL